MEAPTTLENIEQFINKWEKGNVRPYRRSEGMPIIKLVGQTYDDMIRHSTFDTVALLYSPVCGVCKAFKPIFEKVSQEVPYYAYMRFAEIDMTKNEVEGMLDIGYPTVCMYHGGEFEKPIFYNNSFSEEEFRTFLSDYATNKFEFIKGSAEEYGANRTIDKEDDKKGNEMKKDL